MQSKIQSELAGIIYRNSKDEKEIAYLLVKIPLDITTNALSAFAEALREVAPKLSLEARERMEERLNAIQKDVQQLREQRVEISLEGREDIIKTIEEIQEQMRRAKRAMEQYIS